VTKDELDALKHEWYERGKRHGREEMLAAIRELLNVPSREDVLEDIEQAK